MRQRRPLEDRLWPRVDASGPCWLWQGKLSDGYGHIGLGGDGGAKRPVHRVVWELLVGPIPPGLQIDHLCRVRHCCNPDHLQLVTTAENLARSPIANGKGKTHCKRGHPLTGGNVRYRPNGGRGCRTCNGATPSLFETS